MKTLVVVVLALGLAAPALASDRHPTLGELEGEVMCPTCKTTLDQSSAPIADRIRQFITARIAAGDTKSEIKAKLVAQFGPAVLAEPSKHGFNLLAWVLPLVGIGLAARGARPAGLALDALARAGGGGRRPRRSTRSSTAGWTTSLLASNSGRDRLDG